jgi:hypothetical protein
MEEMNIKIIEMVVLGKGNSETKAERRSLSLKGMDIKDAKELR